MSGCGALISCTLLRCEVAHDAMTCHVVMILHPNSRDYERVSVPAAAVLCGTGPVYPVDSGHYPPWPRIMPGSPHHNGAKEAVTGIKWPGPAPDFLCREMRWDGTP